MLNHFNFKRHGKDQVLITNDFGRFAFLSAKEFQSLVREDIPKGSALYEKLHRDLFIVDSFTPYSSETIDHLREIKNYLFSGTALHIFVVTDVCNMNCIYCQARDKERHPHGFMTEEIGRKAINIALQSPSNHLTFEFQGGEPLLNFPVIRAMIEYSESVKGSRVIEYTLVSNLSLLTDEILDFLIQYRVNICTSIDGPQELHDYNRRHQGSSFALMTAGFEKIRNRGYPVSAIETTTRFSLPYAADIVWTYQKLGAPGIFLRPLTPLGFAKSDWEKIGYTAEEFLQFYRKAFEEILKINREGCRFPEQHAVYFLKRMLHGYSYNYMELRSPCGASIGQLAYYYDGNIYTCDEARMVAESGDDAFRLGNVFDSSYQDLMDSGPCKATCAASVLESIPGCCDCVYQPYCGVCPVINYAMNGDIFPREQSGYRCMVYRGILDFLFELIQANDSETMRILNTWLTDGG